MEQYSCGALNQWNRKQQTHQNAVFNLTFQLLTIFYQINGNRLGQHSLQKRMSLKHKLRKLFLKADLFGHKVQLNVNGDSAIKSIFGSVVSQLIYVTVLAFFLYRLQVMVTYGATKVTQNVIPDAVSHDFTFDFDENNFKIAVGVKSLNSSNVLDDYAEIMFRLSFGYDAAEPIPLASHKCTDEDIAEFYPLQQPQPAGFFYFMQCLDRGQKITVQGINQLKAFTLFQAELKPCKNTTTKTCPQTTLQEVLNKIGVANFYVLYNSQVLDKTKYTDSGIVNKAKINMLQFVPDTPKFFASTLKKTELSDETDWIQFGQSTQATLWDFEFGTSQKSSSQRNFTTGFYKFMGIDILIDPQVTVVDRKTYDLLSLLGEVGGLFSSLQIIGFVFVSWYSGIHAATFFIIQLFLQRSEQSKQQTPDKDKLIQIMVQDFQQRKKFALFQTLVGACARKKSIYQIGKQKIDREFDVLRMIRHHRLLACQMVSLLTPDQTRFAKLLAHQVLSDPQTESDETVQTEFPYLQNCLAQNTIQDQRLFQHYQEQCWNRTSLKQKQNAKLNKGKVVNLEIPVKIPTLRQNKNSLIINGTKLSGDGKTLTYYSLRKKRRNRQHN